MPPNVHAELVLNALGRAWSRKADTPRHTSHSRIMMAVLSTYARVCRYLAMKRMLKGSFRITNKVGHKETHL